MRHIMGWTALQHGITTSTIAPAGLFFWKGRFNLPKYSFGEYLNWTNSLGEYVNFQKIFWGISYKSVEEYYSYIWTALQHGITKSTIA